MPEHIKHTPRGLYPNSETPVRLLAGLDITRLIMTKGFRFRLEGQENLHEVPQDQPLIAVTTHLTDLDVPVAASYIGRHRNIVIANTIDQHSIKEPVGFVGTRLMGPKNFYPLTVSPGKSALFEPENYEPLAAEIESGKTVVIAGYNTGYEGRLRDRPGVGAVYLQALTGATLLPVAVDIQLKNPPDNAVASWGKMFATTPPAPIRIGAPISFPKIEGLEDAFRAERVKGRHPTDSLSERTRRLLAITTELRRRSKIMARAHAQLLPPEKRGIWGE